jgi:hypothetical protein
VQLLPEEREVMNKILELCLSYGVDVEIFHGISPSKAVNSGDDYRFTFLRMGALIKLPAPIRVDFGDRKHGTQVSRIHLASDHTVTFTQDELLRAISSFHPTAQWGTAANSNPAHQFPYPVGTADVNTVDDEIVQTTEAEVQFSGVISSFPTVHTDPLFGNFIVFAVTDVPLILPHAPEFISEEYLTSINVRVFADGDAAVYNDLMDLRGKRVNLRGQYVFSGKHIAFEVKPSGFSEAR